MLRNHDKTFNGRRTEKDDLGKGPVVSVGVVWPSVDSSSAGSFNSSYWDNDGLVVS
jgi:hypothetical protein